MCNLSWTPHSSLEKDSSLNHSCVTPKMGHLEYITKNYTIRHPESNCHSYQHQTCHLVDLQNTEKARYDYAKSIPHPHTFATVSPLYNIPSASCCRLTAASVVSCGAADP